MHILAFFKPPDVADPRKWRTFGKRLPDGTIIKKRRYRGWGHVTLKTAAFGAGLGYICDFSPIDTTATDDDAHAVNTVIHYVTKYLTKATQGDLPKGTRRVQASQKFKVGVVNVNDDGTWRLAAQVYYTDVLRIGDVRDLSRHRVITIELFETLGVGALPLWDDTY